MERSAVADPLVGHLLDGRYRIESKLARGGMATVYAGTDLRLDRRVAIKVLPHALGDDADFAARFVREARAAARLTSPYVVAVHDQGEDGGLLFLVMEYVEGRRTLRDVVRETARLPPVRALAVVEDVLHALSAAHEAGIVHRDVKPENVLIGPRGQVKVADFGLARAVSASTSATTPGLLMGTVSYLPPELVLDGGADARSDVYSVGVLLFELLTGSKPHTADTPLQVAYKHVHEDVPPPSRFVAGVPPYLDALVARATARQRDLRPADAHVLLQQLRRVRHALEHGVADDVELTQDLTPTVAVSSLSRDVRATIVGSAASRPEPTVDDPRSEASAQVPWLGPPQPPAPTAPARTRRRRARRLALLVVVVAVVAVVAAGGVAGWYYGVGRYEDTPKVTGLPQAAAVARLRASDLTLEVSRAAYSEKVPDGALISTDPAPGDRVVKGGTVHAVISKGPERHDVPDLTGMSQEQALGAITDRHLGVGQVRQAWSANVPAGTVVGFHPAAGTPLRRGGPVVVVVSKGPRPIPIPSYVHKHAQVAVAQLGKLGFDVGQDQRYNDNVPAGDVISQSPNAGVGHRGDTVTLIVSQGPHLVEVPSVGHDGVSAAEEALTGAGFKVTVMHNTPYFGLGFVVSQSPGGSQMAPYGSTVVVYIV